MGSLKAKLKHAFAVDEEAVHEPVAQQQPAIDWLCIQTAKRRLTTPGLIFLEMTRPLNWVASQAMHCTEPALRGALWAVVPHVQHRAMRHYASLARFLEHRGSIEYVARRVEFFEAEFTRLEKERSSIRDYIKQHMEQVLKRASDTYKDQNAGSTVEHDGSQV